MDKRSVHRRHSPDRSDERSKKHGRLRYHEVSEQEKLRAREERRKLWEIQQQKEREHELLKQKKIEEYERKRAEALALSKKNSTHRSRSKSRSRSLDLFHKSHENGDSKEKPYMLSQRFNSSTGNVLSPREPKGTSKYDENELKMVIVKIDRKLPRPSRSSDIQRDLVDPSQITLKRRQGEGVRPIFDREELKANDHEVEERRTIEAVKKPNSVIEHGRHRSISSPRRGRSPSPRARSSSVRHRSRSKEHSKSYHEEKHQESARRRSRSRESSRKRSKSRERSRERSYSREQRRSERDDSRTSRSEKEHRDHRRKSRDRSHSCERRESSRERRLPVGSYVEPLPYPVYYSAYPPRPIMYAPMPPPPRGPMVREPMPPIHPSYPPRYMAPSNMYRGGPPSDSRHGRMF